MTSEDIKHQLIIIIGPLQSFSVMTDTVADADDGEDGDINGGVDDNKEGEERERKRETGTTLTEVGA